MLHNGSEGHPFEGTVEVPAFLGSVEITYKPGNQVILRATLADDRRFSYWLGDVPSGQEQDNPLTMVLDQDLSLTAVFTPRYKLTVNNGIGSGTYDANQLVPIEATAQDGQPFDRWTGDTANVADTNAAFTTVVMSGDTTLTAAFVTPQSAACCAAAGPPLLLVGLALLMLTSRFRPGRSWSSGN